MTEIWTILLELLNQPAIRAVTVLFFVLSLVFSIWAFRKTSAAANMSSDTSAQSTPGYWRVSGARPTA